MTPPESATYCASSATCRVLDAFLVGYGLVATVYDPRCFVKITPGTFLFVLVHVDDLRITASTHAVCIAFVKA